MVGGGYLFSERRGDFRFRTGGGRGVRGWRWGDEKGKGLRVLNLGGLWGKVLREEGWVKLKGGATRNYGRCGWRKERG